MGDAGDTSAVPALLEAAGALFVVAGVFLIWLPAGLIAIGIVLILAAVAVERAPADKPVSRVS